MKPRCLPLPAANSLIKADTAEVLPWVAQAGHSARFAFEEFFHGQIRNPLTRKAYLRAVRVFARWCEERGLERELFTADIVPKVGNVNYGTNVVFSPDGRCIATGSGSTVKIFDARDGAELLSFDDGGTALAFSHDGKRLASGGPGFKIWDAKSGRELASSRDGDRIRALAFSPDGHRLAGASADGAVIIWDASSGHQTLTFDYTDDRAFSGAGATKQSHNIAFSADGNRLGSIIWDGTVRIWDATPLPEKP